MEILDKHARSQQFQRRLAEALAEKGRSQSALARVIGVDRSTISQLLNASDARMPNAHVVAGCASALGVSSDWLLGLSDRPETAAELISASSQITRAPRALVDEQIFAWHVEAEGYKVRHVPAALPDMLKTRDMLRWEYAPHLGKTTDQAIGASEDKLSFLRRAKSEQEIALPIFEIDSFAQAEGYYSGLPRSIRKKQIDWILDLYDQLYPRLRFILFDARRVYSAPITVFGPLLAVLYIGQSYLSFRDSERIEALTNHFDRLVREAAVSDREIVGHLERLRQEI